MFRLSLGLTSSGSWDIIKVFLLWVGWYNWCKSDEDGMSSGSSCGNEQVEKVGNSNYQKKCDKFWRDSHVLCDTPATQVTGLYQPWSHSPFFCTLQLHPTWLMTPTVRFSWRLHSIVKVWSPIMTPRVINSTRTSGVTFSTRREKPLVKVFNNFSVSWAVIW